MFSKHCRLSRRISRTVAIWTKQKQSHLSNRPVDTLYNMLLGITINRWNQRVSGTLTRNSYVSRVSMHGHEAEWRGTGVDGAKSLRVDFLRPSRPFSGPDRIGRPGGARAPSSSARKTLRTRRETSCRSPRTTLSFSWTIQYRCG